MDDLERQLRAWTDSTTSDAGTPVSAEEAIERAERGTRSIRRDGTRRSRVLAGTVAAALVLVAVIGVGYLSANRGGNDTDVAGSPEVTTPSIPGDGQGMTVLGIGAPLVPPLDMLQLTQDSEGLAAMWATAGLGGEVPSIDFTEQVVMGFTVLSDLCGVDAETYEALALALAEELDPELVMVGRRIAPDCAGPLVSRTLVIAVDRA